MPRSQSVSSDCYLYWAHFFCLRVAEIQYFFLVLFHCCFLVFSGSLRPGCPQKAFQTLGSSIPCHSSHKASWGNVNCQLSTTGRIFGTTGVEHVGHVEPISVFGQPTWGPKAGNAGAGNPTTYTMDDDDAVEASAPIPRKGGASAGQGRFLFHGQCLCELLACSWRRYIGQTAGWNVHENKDLY